MITRRRGLVGLLTAQAVSLTGTRLSMIALPWFVLVTTGSAAQTGLVAFCEMAPYVVAKALSGPILDRAGQRRVSVTADVVSALVVGAVPLLHAMHVLTFPALLGMVALAGAARAPGDTAKSTLVPEVAAVANVPLERATGLAGTVDRLSQTVGPLLAGALVAALGPLTALLVDAASFAIAAVVIAGAVPRRQVAGGEDGGGYLSRFRAGLDFLRRDRLLRAIVVMVAATNTIDAAVSTVLIPVWARDTGVGPAAIGAVLAAFGCTAVLGSIVAAGIAHRLPRRTTYFVAFLICGSPRIAVLALDLPVWLVVGVYAVSGLGTGFINPILSAVLFERIPQSMLGSVGGLAGTLAFAGIPLGGLGGGLLIALVGLAPTALVCAAVYFVATMLPGLRPEWRELDRATPRAAPARV